MPFKVQVLRYACVTSGRVVFYFQIISYANGANFDFSFYCKKSPICPSTK